jgi:hypothetical protein
MKTIVRLDNNISLYVFEDTTLIDVHEDKIIITSDEIMTISDCNSANTIVYENITAPDDWRGWKYFFDGSEWTLNEDWVEPTLST